MKTNSNASSQAKGFIAFPRSFFGSKLWTDITHFTPTEALLDLYNMAYYGAKPVERTINRTVVLLKHGQIVVTINFLSQRWSMHVGCVRRLLKKFCDKGFVNLNGRGSHTLISVNEQLLDTPEEKTDNLNGNLNGNNKKKSNKEEDKNIPLMSPLEGESPRTRGGNCLVGGGDAARVGASRNTRKNASESARENASGDECARSLFDDSSASASADASRVAPTDAAIAPTDAAIARSKAKRKAFVPPTLEQVAEQCRLKGYALISPEAFWAYYEANGWRVGRSPMRSWTAALAMWQARERKWNSAGQTARNAAAAYAYGDAAASAATSASASADAGRVAPTDVAVAPTDMTIAPTDVSIASSHFIPSNPLTSTYETSYQLNANCLPGARRLYPNKRDADFEALQQFRARQAGDIACMDEAEPEF